MPRTAKKSKNFNIARNCDHQNCSQGYCDDCGQYIEEVYQINNYSTQHAPISAQKCTFDKEIRKLNFPLYIQDCAIKIYEIMKKPTCRSGKLRHSCR